MTIDKAKSVINELKLYVEDLHSYSADDVSETLEFVTKALEQKSYKSEARRWKRRYLDLKQRIIKLEEQTRWIPVSERLPEDNIHVLCQFYLGGMGECYLAHGMFHVVGGVVMTCNEVIAWMPLPQPYNAESEVNADDD